MRFNPKARLDTSRVRDDGGAGASGGGSRIPLPGGSMAGGGIGGVLLLLVIFLLAQCSGVDLTGGSGTGTGTGNALGTDVSRVGAQADRYANCTTGEDANTDVDCARIAVENSLYGYWRETLPAQSDTTFQAAQMLTFSGAVNTGCGRATSQVGPFYCPPDQAIYLDTTFFDDVLERQLGGPDGGFVEPYVIGHEYGHHIQNLLGAMGRVKTQQGPRSDAVRLELQADCYAGMWAQAATSTTDASGAVLFSELTQDDIQQAIDAAEAVGDDRIQLKTQGQVTKESWTHGSAASRARWFQVGYDEGTLRACDTWAVDTP